MLQITRGAQGEVLLAGRFDAAEAAEAERVFDGLGSGTLVDMSGLEYISSMGLGVLLKTQKRLRQAGTGALRIVGANKHIRDIFRYAGLQQIFEIEGGPA